MQLNVKIILGGQITAATSAQTVISPALSAQEPAMFNALFAKQDRLIQINISIPTPAIPTPNAITWEDMEMIVITFAKLVTQGVLDAQLQDGPAVTNAM